LIGKYFSLTNFFNYKQTHENLKNNLLKTSFQETNTEKKNIFFLKKHSQLKSHADDTGRLQKQMKQASRHLMT
jgi:hypothetical protein